MGSSRVVREWESHGLECIVRRVCLGPSSHPCGYVVVPDERWCEVLDAVDVGLISANGYITYTGLVPVLGDRRLCIGFDMAHEWDGCEGPDGVWRCSRSDEECMHATEKLAADVAELLGGGRHGCA